MKALNGGVGMTDAEVKAFIGRYMPCYLLFSEGIENGYNTGSNSRDAGHPPWKGHLLRATIDEDRKVVAVQHL